MSSPKTSKTLHFNFGAFFWCVMAALAVTHVVDLVIDMGFWGTLFLGYVIGNLYEWSHNVRIVEWR